MYLLGIALLLSVLKLAEIGPMATWPWWYILCVYGAAALWWIWADWSGYTKRKAEEKMEVRRQARIEKHKAALRSGGDVRRRR